MKTGGGSLKASTGKRVLRGWERNIDDAKPVHTPYLSGLEVCQYCEKVSFPIVLLYDGHEILCTHLWGKKVRDRAIKSGA